MTTDNLPPFKDWFIDEFKDWENSQPDRRASVTAFARWLSDNTLNVVVRQQNVDAWMNGKIPKDYKYVVVLAEKLDNTIYEILNLPQPNLYLQRVNRRWEFLPEEIQKKIDEETAIYETKNISKQLPKPSERRKVRKTK